MITFTMPDFPDPVVPPIRTFRRRIRALTGRPSSNSPSSHGPGYRGVRLAGPVDRLGVRVSFDNPQDYPVGPVRVGNRADATRA